LCVILLIFLWLWLSNTLSIQILLLNFTWKEEELFWKICILFLETNMFVIDLYIHIERLLALKRKKKIEIKYPIASKFWDARTELNNFENYEDWNAYIIENFESPRKCKDLNAYIIENFENPRWLQPSLITGVWFSGINIAFACIIACVVMQVYILS